MLFISGRSSRASRKPPNAPMEPENNEIKSNSVTSVKLIRVLSIPIVFKIFTVSLRWSYAIPTLVYTINIPTKKERNPNALMLNVKLSEINLNSPALLSSINIKFLSGSLSRVFKLLFIYSKYVNLPSIFSRLWTEVISPIRVSSGK